MINPKYAIVVMGACLCMCGCNGTDSLVETTTSSSPQSGKASTSSNSAQTAETTTPNQSGQEGGDQMASDDADSAQNNHEEDSASGNFKSEINGTDGSWGNSARMHIDDHNRNEATSRVACGGYDQIPRAIKFRAVAANITSGNKQAYEGPGIRIFQGLKPDIALIQEFNYQGNRSDMVDQAFGSDYQFFAGYGQIPNGIVSKYPIIQTGEWKSNEISNRNWTWAVIDIPGKKDILAVSVHLSTNKRKQVSEMRLLSNYIQQKASECDYYVMLGGDFNTKRSSYVHRYFGNFLSTDGPYPVDNLGNSATNASRSYTYDWLLTGSGLEQARVPVVIGRNSFENGLVFDTRVYSPLSDVSPARKGDSDEDNMQHMAVVKDFSIQGPTGSEDNNGSDDNGSVDNAGLDDNSGVDNGSTDNAGSDDNSGVDNGSTDNAGSDDNSGVDNGSSEDGSTNSSSPAIDARLKSDEHNRNYVGANVKCGGFDVSNKSTQFRVMAANTTSGNAQSYQDPGIRMFQGLKPDIALVQEFNYSGSRQDLINQAFGKNYYFYAGYGQIPNGIVSKYPIIDAGEWESNIIRNRNWTWAVIDIPGKRDVLAVSVHLSTKRHDSELALLKSKIAAKQRECNYYVVLGGDFNTKNRHSVIRTFSSMMGFSGYYPVDTNGREGTNSARRYPYDWVLADKDLSSSEVPVNIGSKSFSHGLVFDSWTYSPLRDVSPVLKEDSRALNMQHMPVIRQFSIK